MSNQCRVLSPVCLYAGASFFDFGIRIIDEDGLPIDITGYEATYTWTRLGDSAPVIDLDQTDSELVVGAGDDDNQLTISLLGTDTSVATGTYCARYMVDDTAGNVWIATRIITVREGCC